MEWGLLGLPEKAFGEVMLRNLTPDELAAYIERQEG